jgi:hypothetical protein
MAKEPPVDQGNLKAVRGIGPKVEARLRKAGITDLGQLARTPPNELAAMLEGLPGRFDPDRIAREGWLAQAAALAATAPTARAKETETGTRIRHNFTVEVQLEIAGRDIVSSKVVHVQTLDEATWAGWDGARLVAFIENRVGAAAGAPRLAEEAPGASQSLRDQAESGGGDAAIAAVHTFAMVPADGVIAAREIIATLTFDTAVLHLPPHQVGHATVDVFAHRPPPGKSILVGSRSASIVADQAVTLDIPCQLPAAEHPLALFAAVQVRVTNGPGHPPSNVLPDACLAVSKTSAVLSREAGAAASGHGSAQSSAHAISEAY